MKLPRFWAGIFGVLSAFGLRAAEPVLPPGPTIALPPITVTDSQLLPPPESWRYAHIPGFEILSSASDSETQRLMRDFSTFLQAVDIVWPAMTQNSGVPAAIILCERPGEFAQFMPTANDNATMGSISLCLRDKEQAAIAIDVGTSSLTLNSLDAIQAGDNGPAIPGAGALNGVGVGAQDFLVNRYEQLHREYIHFLMGRVTPRPPPWLEEGLAQLFMNMTYTPTRIRFGKLENPNSVTALQAQSVGIRRAGGSTPSSAPPEEDRQFNTYFAQNGLLPLDQVFSVEANSPEATQVLDGTWAKECACFVHLCIYGEKGRYQKSFLEFVNRATREPVTEALFQSCFKLSYAQMLVEMRGYLQFANYGFKDFKPKNGEKIPFPPPLELREATQAEVGRIKGDALRLAGRLDAAHLALIAPYIRGERDPELLAAIGLDEHAQSQDERARKFLEAAAAAKSGRARAYIVLADLRLAAMEARPAGADGKLSEMQMGQVLTPLFTARALGPPLPEVYEGIADAWTHSATGPTHDNLAVLDEGVRTFPTDTVLIYRDALLQLHAGFPAEAQALTSLGLREAPDAATRATFSALSAPPAPPP